MIGVIEAKNLIQENCCSSIIREIKISEAFGYILSEPAFSISDTPPFNQSAMDGYAFSFSSWDKKARLKIMGEIQAGSYFTDPVKPENAVRIFTGAALPDGTDTVVMQEKISAIDNSIIIKDAKISHGNNVRLKGSQSKCGSLLLPEGTYLLPAAIAFLASEGIQSVNVYSKPKISIVVTGNELIQPGKKLANGKIYESNSSALIACLKQINIVPEVICFSGDDENKICDAISDQVNSDIIILTGGVSVGDYDFVPSSLEKSGYKIIFHHVRQKPGKPFLFAKKNNTLVFALPGNPASAITCFYEYVVPAISCYTRIKYFKNVQLALESDYIKKPGLSFFLKGKTTGSNVTILKNQESYLLNSFAQADCLIELEEEREQYQKGEMVNVLMII